ncbi:MAG: ABC transporter substrate-binding protein [Firmicutes bacterium]|nr:ABC transporter substrate-binding protein [Bacillota bacterium]
MKRNKVLVLLMIGIILPVMVLAGAGNAESKPPVRIAGLSGVSGLAMVKLIEAPALGGRAVTHSIFKSPDLLTGKIVTGEVDIAALPINTAAILYNKGASIQIAAVIGWGVMYLVGDSKVRDWADLKGQTVSAPAKGAVPDLLFRYLLSKNGLNPEEDLTINYVGSPVELAQLIASGAGSLAVLPEPWVTQVMERNPKLQVLLDFQREWQRIEKQGQTYPQTCIAVNRKFAESNREFVRLYLEELDGAIGWLNRNPESAGLLAEKHVQISAGAVKKGLARCNLRFENALTARPEIDRFLLRLSELAPDAIGGKLPDEKFYYQP